MTAKLLVWGALCVIRRDQQACADLDNLEDLTPAQRNWLAYLATRRDVFAIPMANCAGYKFSRRFDEGIDPNRDFPYSRKDDKCFLSKTAQLFHHLLEENIIQLVVTFHGGMVAIGYEWGSRNHPSPKDSSPDEEAYRRIGYLMRDFAGKFKQERLYPGTVDQLSRHSALISLPFSWPREFCDLSRRWWYGGLALCCGMGFQHAAKALPGITAPPTFPTVWEPF